MLVELTKRITEKIIELKKYSQESADNDSDYECIDYQITGLEIALEIIQDLLNEKLENINSDKNESKKIKKD